jgi:hypothetical protein
MGDAAGYGYPVPEGGDSHAFDAHASDGTADTSPADAGAADALDVVRVDAAETVDAPSDAGTSDEPTPTLGCYIKPGGASVVTECAQVGLAEVGVACNDSTDCDALLACVEVNGQAVCRPVSCALPIQCPSGNFYQEAPLRVAGVTRADIKVPVCLPNDHCMLLAMPNPCPLGEVCAVVGGEGETTCIIPGTAQQGDWCDEATRCAEGLLCSKFKNQCVKLCHVGSGTAECPGGMCQGGNRSVPYGFGICVGQNTDAGL